MNQYEFQKITRQMELKYGKIRKGEEDIHSMMLFPMESNLLKAHRSNPASNSRRLLEAINLVLYEVEGHISGKEYNLEKFESEDNLKLKHALLMAFDPFTNDELYELMQKEGKFDFSDMEALEIFYQEPVRCILRIKDSVEFWIKKQGADGYFLFLDEWIGAELPDDEKYDFAVLASHDVMHIEET